jgi:hypothetical protein
MPSRSPSLSIMTYLALAGGAARTRHCGTGRRVDIQPADLVPELGPLLTCRRQAPGDAGGRDRRADALTTARAPLTARPAGPRPGLAAAAHRGRYRRRPGRH